MNMFKNVFSFKKNKPVISQDQSLEIERLKKEIHNLNTELMRERLNIKPSRRVVMSKEPKHELVLNHLKSGKIITGLIALDMYGLYRLSSVINRLRKKGHDISTVMRENKGVTYAEYKMVSFN